MKCELLHYFFFFFSPADVAGSATPHFLIDMVEVLEKESGTEVVHCLLRHCCKKFTGQISQAYFEWLQNRYFNTPLENCVSNSFQVCCSEKDKHE